MSEQQPRTPDIDATVGSDRLVVEHVIDNKPKGFERFVQNAKRVGAVAMVGAVAVAGIQVKSWIDDWRNPFSTESSHAVTLEVGAPETDIYEDVYLNFAQINTTFPISLDTSLDRPGPSNCDTKTRHTGKKGEDPKITAGVSAGIFVESLSVTKRDNQLTATVNGDLTLSDTSVDYGENNIHVEGARGVFDVCIKSSETNKARNILDVAIQNTGSVAASCALKDEAGRKVFDKAIRKFIGNTDMADELSREQLSSMRVRYSDYNSSADAVYGQSVGEFRHNVDGVINRYLKETDKHKKPTINDRELINCEVHRIKIAADSANA